MGLIIGPSVKGDQDLTANETLSGYAGEARLTGRVITCHARSRPPASAGGLFRMYVKSRPPRKPQARRSHSTPGIGTP
jgi:hypothetical protein